MKPAVQGVTVNGVTLFTPLSIITGAATTSSRSTTTPARRSGTSRFGAGAGGGGRMRGAAGRRHADGRRSCSRRPPRRAAAARAAGAGGGYSSSVGQPGEGVPVPAGGRGGRGAAPAPGAPRGAPGAAPAGAPRGARRGSAGGRAAGAAARLRQRVRAGGRQAPGAAPGRCPARRRSRGGGGGGFGRPSGVVYVIARDGMLHTVGLPSAKDIQKPAPFVPAGARVTDPIAVNDILYTSTTGKCGGTADAVYAMDLSSDAKPVVRYKTTGSPVGALALTTDGTVVVAVTNGIVTLDAKTLAVKHSYTDANTTFVTGPLVFRQGDKDVIAAGTKDGQHRPARRRDTRWRRLRRRRR